MTSTPMRDPAEGQVVSMPRPADGIELPRIPQQARSRRKQEQLVDAAERLFAEHGYDQVTAEDIGAAAGLPVGTFYNYFASKSQILVMVVDRHEPAVLPTLQPVIDAFAEGADITRAVTDAVRAIAQGKAAMPWLRRTWLRLVHASEEVAAHQRAVDQAWEAQIAALLAEGVSAGRLRVVDPWATALVVRTAVESVTDQLLWHGGCDVEAVVHACGQLITDAVERDRRSPW